MESRKPNSGSFKKGQKPWGTKGYTNSGSFKKGERRSKKTEFKKGGHPGKEFKKGQEPWNKGTKGLMPIPYNKGKKMSKELRKKFSMAQKKLNLEHPERLEVLRQVNLGRKHTTEAKKNMSIAQKRLAKTKFTSEYRKKLSIATRKIKRPQRDNKFELSFQDILREKDIEFKDHVNLIGQPDVFIEPNLCIFLDGDRFHANPSMYSDDTIIWKEYNRKGRHVPVQTAKIIHEKDERINNELRTGGYEIIRIWQSEFEKNPEKCLQKIIKIIKESKPKS